MGRVSIDVAELAMAKGRRLQQWFPIHFVPQVITHVWSALHLHLSCLTDSNVQHHKPWQTRTIDRSHVRAQEKKGIVHENDGDVSVSAENKKSEIYLELKYTGDYYR